MKKRWREHRSTALTAFGERQVISVEAVASLCMVVFVFMASQSPGASLIPGIVLMKDQFLCFDSRWFTGGSMKLALSLSKSEKFRF